MGSYVLATVLLFSLLGCGLSSWVRGGARGKRPLDYPGSKHGFDYPGKHGFEYPSKHGFDYPGKRREPPPTVEVEYPDVAREDGELATTLTENPVVCEVCKFVVSDLQSLLGNDSSKIIAFLDSLCADLPAAYAATCKQYVDGWTPFIIDFLENSTPDEICAELTLCTALQTDVDHRLGMNPFGRFFRLFKEVFKTNLDKVMMRQALGNEYLCQACDEIVDALYTQLITDHVLDELTDVLKEVCSITPVAAECDQFVDEVSKEVETLIKLYLNNQTCADIGLCPGFEVDRMNPLSEIFDAIIPDDFDMDFISDRFRPRPRPRPDTEPAPRDHPHRDHDRNNSRGWPRPGHNDHHGHRNHSGDHHNHTSSRPHHPYRPHFNPFRRDHPHHGRGSVDTPRPDFSRWFFWSRPSHEGSRTRPTSPLHPMSPLKPNKTSNPMPEPEAPRPTLPFVPNPKVGNIDPKRPYIPKKPFIPRLPEDMPVPRVDLGVGVPNRENRRPQFPGKHHQRGEMKGNRRKQRSVVINSINGEVLDNGHRYDIESEFNSEVETVWQCDACRYGVDLVKNSLMERAGPIQDKLMTVANSICNKLPVTTVAECKTEVANVLNGLVVKAINNYVTPDKVCPFLKLC